MADDIAVSQDLWDALLAKVAPVDTGKTIFGMKVFLDPELKPGEWKLVPPKSNPSERAPRS